MSRKDISNEEAKEQIFNYGSKISTGDVGAIAAQSEKAIGIFSKTRKLVGFVKDIGNVLSMLKDYASGNYKDVPWRIIASLTGSVVYVFSPIDMIPDLIPIIGFADDATVFATVMRFAHGDIDKYLKWKRGDGNREILQVAAPSQVSEQKQGFVDGNVGEASVSMDGLNTINDERSLGDMEMASRVTKHRKRTKGITLAIGQPDNNAKNESSEVVKIGVSRNGARKGRNVAVESVEITDKATMTEAKVGTKKGRKGGKIPKTPDDGKDVMVKLKKSKRGIVGTSEKETCAFRSSSSAKGDSPKKTIMEAVKIAVGKLGKSVFYEGDSIPEKKLKNAIEVMGVRSDEMVYALIDSTLFGSGKCGLVVTSFGIRWKNDWANDTVDTCYSWNEFREIASRMKATEYTLDFSKESRVGVAGSGVESKELKKVLNHILQLAF